MSGFGRVISGGAQMRKGLTGGINDKLEQLDAKRDAREKLADIVKNGFKYKNLSAPTWNDIQVGQKTTAFGGKKGNNLTPPTRPSKV